MNTNGFIRLILPYLLIMCMVVGGLSFQNSYVVAGTSEMTKTDDQHIVMNIKSESSIQNIDKAMFSNYQWEKINLPVDISFVRKFEVDPQNANKAYIASSVGLYRTEDAGNTWNVVNSSIIFVDQIEIAPSNGQRMYIKYRTWDQPLRWYRSDDGGATTALIEAPSDICGLSIAPTDQNRLYGFICKETGSPTVVRSNDGGLSWMSPAMEFLNPITSLIIHPNNANILIASRYSNSYRSTDGGTNWVRMNTGDASPMFYVFDPYPPYTLYVSTIAEWNDLQRSFDNGETWQKADIGRFFSFYFFSPDSSGIILGGNEYEDDIWQINSVDNAWSALRLNTPTNFVSISRSANDFQTVYAKSADGYWRYTIHDLPFHKHLFLPLINKIAITIDPIAKIAVDRANLYRNLVGVSALKPHPSIITAAQNHANYIVLNHRDPSAWLYGSLHTEVEGKPGFTGIWEADRMKAAGYHGAGLAEILTSAGDPMLSVDGWVATVFHRFPLLNPAYNHAGYGFAKTSSFTVDVMNFGFGRDNTGFWSPIISYPIAYPADGQKNVPTLWWGYESPDPLPPGAKRPVGYPFTLQAPMFMQVYSISFKDKYGIDVPIHPNPQDCETYYYCFAAIPVSPLQTNMTYTVHAVGNWRNKPFDRVWTFTTGTSLSSISSFQGDQIPVSIINISVLE